MANGLLDFQTCGIALDESLEQQGGGKLPKPKMLILAERQKTYSTTGHEGRYSFNREYVSRGHDFWNIPAGTQERFDAINLFNFKRDSTYQSLSEEQKAGYAKQDSVHDAEDLKEARFFTREANWFKGQNPEIDIEVAEFRGEEELTNVLTSAASKYKGQNINLGIFGHAGTKYGDVSSDTFGSITKSSGFLDSCTVDEVLMGSCGLGGPGYAVVRNNLAQAFQAKVTGQNKTFGTSKRTPEDIQAFKDTGVSDIGSRLFNSGAEINSTEYIPGTPIRTAAQMQADRQIARLNAFARANNCVIPGSDLPNSLSEVRQPSLEDLQAAPQRPEDFINIINQIAELP